MSDISVVMGSKSDWPTVKETCDILDEKDKHLRAKNIEVVFPLSKERKKLIKN